MGSDKGWSPGVSAFHRAEDGTNTGVASTVFGPGDLLNTVWHLFALLKDAAKEWAPKRSCV